MYLNNYSAANIKLPFVTDDLLYSQRYKHMLIHVLPAIHPIAYMAN